MSAALVGKQSSLVFTIPNGAALKFPEYRPNAETKEPDMTLNDTRRNALDKLSTIVQQGAIHSFEDSLQSLKDDPWQYLTENLPDSWEENFDTFDRIRQMSEEEVLATINESAMAGSTTYKSTADSSVEHACNEYESYMEAMSALDRFSTETLAYILSTYDGGVDRMYYDRLQSVIPSNNDLDNLIALGDDIELITRNLVSYRRSGVPLWKRRVFDDVRLSDPALDRPDLYSLTGENWKWATRIIDISLYSRLATCTRITKGKTGLTGKAAISAEIKRTRNDPCITRELALLLKEGDEWVERVKGFMEQRKLSGTEVSPDLLRDMYSHKASSLHIGVL